MPYFGADLRGDHLLTENEVARSWRQLVASGTMSPDVVEKAEALLEELRAESPLRHRLATELVELQALYDVKVNGAAKKTKGRKKLAAS